MSSAKQDVVAALQELAELTLLEEQDPNSFRVRAYEKALLSLAPVGEELRGMDEKALQAIPGIGKSTAAKIRELLTTGKIEKLEELRRRFPPGYRRLLRVPDLGPKSMHKLRAGLGIESLEQLEAAIRSGEVAKLAGFGEKKAQNLLRALERLGGAQAAEAWPIADAMPVARRLVEKLRQLAPRADFCGSLRRLSETVRDLDIVVATDQPDALAPRVQEALGAPEVLASGPTKVSVRLESGLQVDVRLVPPASYGAAQLYFTGSKAHNIKLRQLAMARGWILSEYALAERDSQRVVAAATEESIYQALGLPFIPPPMRQDNGELEGLPGFVERGQLIGDLHVHTDTSGDGKSPIEDMLEQGRARGYRYMAVTDHAEDLPVSGVGRDVMLAQRQKLAGLRGRFSDLTVLHGCELNIGPEGGLDYDAEFRAGFDWCVAAVHSHFDLSPGEQTRRLLTAMRDRTVNVIGHLSGRRIGRRPGIEVDVDAVLQAAEETGCAIEINSALSRLDASADVLRRARGKDVTFVISTDSHHVSEYERLDWGAQQAQRGWVDPERIANTWAPERFLEWARARRRGP